MNKSVDGTEITPRQITPQRVIMRNPQNLSNFDFIAINKKNRLHC
jgi:hypothetical protein